VTIPFVHELASDLGKVIASIEARDFPQYKGWFDAERAEYRRSLEEDERANGNYWFAGSRELPCRSMSGPRLLTVLTDNVSAGLSGFFPALRCVACIERCEASAQ
jgi:hypothetical protein